VNAIGTDFWFGSDGVAALPNSSPCARVSTERSRLVARARLGEQKRPELVVRHFRNEPLIYR
jgi:hypothetical protein